VVVLSVPSLTKYKVEQKKSVKENVLKRALRDRVEKVGSDRD